MDYETAIRRALASIDRALRAAPVDADSAREAVARARGALDAWVAEDKPTIVAPGSAWCDALRAQAAADLRAAEILGATGHEPRADAMTTENAPASVLAMLLQMTFEKIAKAALARSDERAFPAYLRTHRAASTMVHQLRRFRRRKHFLVHDWEKLLPHVTALERAHPALARGGPHLEYPWEDEGGVHLPSELPVVADLKDAKRRLGPQLIRLAHTLLDRFDEIWAPRGL